MEKLRRLSTPEEPRELNLAAGRCQQVVAPDDERHTLYMVVNGCGELVRPVAFAIADEQIATLLRRPLLLWTVTQVDEALDARLEPDADADARPLVQPEIATDAGI